MPHILALHLELANFVLPNSILSANAAFRAGIPRSAQVVCLGRASAPSANVLCEVLFTLLALL